MKTTRQKLRTKASMAQELAALKRRVAALEGQRADQEAIATLARVDRTALDDQDDREQVRDHLDAAARNARRKAIDEFNRQYIEARVPGLAEMRRERLVALNEYLATRGMEPEPVR